MTDKNGDASEDGSTRDSLERLVDDIEERRRSDEAEPRASESPPERPDAVEDLVEEAEPTPHPPDASERQRVDVPDFDELDAGNVLVLGPLREPECDATCAGLLDASTPENVLFVTLNHAVENRVGVAREVAAPPDRVAIVRVGSDDQAQERASISTAGGQMGLTVSNVGDPSDLTRVGIAISRCRSQWPEDARAAVCVHSLTELLQYADEQRLFRFVHILQAKLDAPNTAVHFHMDPGAHTRQTLSVFRTLFDAVVEVGDDGAVTVTTGGGE